MSEQKKYESKPGDISIFTNKRKSAPTHPILNGNCIINIHDLKAHADAAGNVKLFVSLWGRKSGAGEDFWSGKIQPPAAPTGTNVVPPGGDAQVNSVLTPEEERFLDEMANQTPEM